MIPVEGARIPTYGKAAFGNQRETHIHNGIDIAAPLGAPVRATAPGRVAIASSTWRQGFTGYGRVVVLEHGAGLAWTLHAHLNTVAVKEGDHVQAGAVLGTVGRSVFSKDDHAEDGTIGAHLHFEVSARPYPLANTVERLDPVAWLAGSAEGEIVYPSSTPTASVGRGLQSGTLLAFALGALVWVARRKAR